MKIFFALLMLFITGFGYTQPRVLEQAIIITKTTIISPEGDEANLPPPPSSVNGEEVRVMRFGGDGETKSLTTLKGNLVKTFTETEMSRTTVIRDNDKKITTTLMEMMGNKIGYFATDEEMALMGKRMDSMMQNRAAANTDNLKSYKPLHNTIAYVEETKKFAGMICKKAFLITEFENGKKDTTAMVWYCPDFKLKGIVSTQSAAGIASSVAGSGRITNLSGLSSLPGFPMMFETKMSRGRKMIAEVIKITTDKEIADNLFEIPKDFVVKPMKDMQGPDGRGVQMRIEARGN